MVGRADIVQMSSRTTQHLSRFGALGLAPECTGMPAQMLFPDIQPALEGTDNGVIVQYETFAVA